MAENNTIDKVNEIVHHLETGKLHKALSTVKNFEGSLKSTGQVFELFIENLIQLATYFSQAKNEIPQLIEGIQEVLEAIETSTIRVLDNTDGILEHHDSIEKTTEKLKQNPVFQEVIGHRLDKIYQAQNKSRMFVFDIIQAQEFQELTRKQTDQLIVSLEDLRKRLLELQNAFNWEDIEGDVEEEKIEETVAEEAEDQSLQKQDLVDQLLAEFGI